MAMTSFERIEVATRLEKPDRIPFVPIIDLFAARYAGITQHQMLFDIKAADAAIQKTMDGLGPIDGFSLSYCGLGSTLGVIFPNPPRLPGVRGVDATAEWSFVEKPVMEPSEYRDIGRRGAIRWTLDKTIQTHPNLNSRIDALKELTKVLWDLNKVTRSVRAWRKKNVEPIMGLNLYFTPMEWMSLMLRGFNDFTLDLFRYPDEIKAASAALRSPLLWMPLAGVKMTGVKRVFMGGARTGPSQISRKQFEELALPEWQEACDYFLRRGITPLLHLDTDWTHFFPLFKNLPRRKCILNLDGASDIYKAKEVLGDHMCIMGDVPATLLKLGEPEEVDAYCEKLLKDLGSEGGFILSSGCSIPVDAKPENVKAMIQSVKKYG